MIEQLHSPNTSADQNFGLITQAPGVLPDSNGLDQWTHGLDQWTPPQRSVRRRHPSNPWRKKPEGGGEKMGIRTHSPRPPQPRHRKNNSHHSPGTVRNPAHQSTTLARPSINNSSPPPPTSTTRRKGCPRRGRDVSGVLCKSLVTYATPIHTNIW